MQDRNPERMENQTAYTEYRKPSWAPPSWLFAPVWTILYILIALSFGYVALEFARKTVPFLVLLPFLLNLVCNVSYTPIQFRLKNYSLALIDIVLVDVTLAWAMIAIYPYAPWVTYTNIPYLCWVTFATALQTSVTTLNKRA